MLVKEKHVKIAVPVSVYHVFKMIQKKNQEDKKRKKQVNFRMFCVEPWRKHGGGRNEPNL